MKVRLSEHKLRAGIPARNSKFYGKGYIMQTYEFYTTVKDGIIVIPKEYRTKIGEKIKVILVDDEKIDDLLLASESSLSFWDNEIDDEVWSRVNIKNKENKNGSRIKK